MQVLTKNRAKLLKLFYSHPEQSYYLQEIGRIIRKKPGVFQRTINRMEKEGILTSEYKANARYFHTNKEYAFYKELKSILDKTKGEGFLIIFMFFLSVFLISGIAQAAESKDALVLSSLKDAIILAYKNNKEIQIQEKEVAVAKAQILGAKSNFLPQINLDTSYTRRGAVLTSTAPSKKDVGVFTGYKNDNQAGISVTEDVYTGGANIANLKQTQLNFKSQEEGLRAKKLDVEFEAKRLYYGLLLAYETERIAKNLVDQAQAHYIEVKDKFNQGTSSKFDLLQSKVQVSLLMPELVKARNAINIVIADLNKLLGLAMQSFIRVEDRLDYSLVEIRESEFLQQAYLNKPEMIIKSLGIDINKWGIKFANATDKPQIGIGANYDFRSNNWGNMFNNRHSNWDVGVSVTIPIFDGFYTKAKVEEAKAKYSQSILSKDNLGDQIALDIKQACLDLVQAKTIIDSQKDNIVEASEALKISEVGYRNGVTINLDVLDSQVNLAQVQKNLAGGIYDYLMAKAQLDRTMGIEYLTEAKNEKKD